MSELRTLNFELTKKCNLKCMHCGIECGYDTNININNEINIETISSVLKEASSMGCKILIIAGGEPLLSKNIWNTLALANKYKLSVSILTNGLMINDKLCEKLSNYKNIKFIRISLDYPSNQEMKTFRGVDNIVTKVIDSLKSLEKYNIPSGIGMSLMPDNIHYIKDVAHIAFENGAKFFRAIPVVPIGMAKKININEDFYVEALKEMIKVAHNYKKTKINYDLKNLTDDMITCCPAGNSSISLTSDGYIGLCPLIDSNIKLEHVTSNSFKKLYYNLRTTKNVFQNKIYKKCNLCKFIYICKGGCTAEKISRNLNDSNQICIKSVLNALQNDTETNKLVKDHLGFSAIISKICKQSNYYMCFRALPIWSIFI